MLKNLLTKLKNWHYETILFQELINSHEAIQRKDVRGYLESQVIFWDYAVKYHGRYSDQFIVAGKALMTKGDQVFGLVAKSFPILLRA